jgi:hypothetical protein
MLQAKYLSVPKCLTYDSTHTAAIVTILPHFRLELKSTMLHIPMQIIENMHVDSSKSEQKLPTHSLGTVQTYLQSERETWHSLFISGKWFHPV